jgi:hypothetical protein
MEEEKRIRERFEYPEVPIMSATSLVTQEGVVLTDYL